MDDKTVHELVKCTRALLLLQLQAPNRPEDQLKPEIVLARAGFSAREIAEMIGKSAAAVTKSIQRAGKEAA